MRIHNTASRTLIVSGSGNLDVRSLVDVGAPGPRIKRGDQGGELPLKHVVVVPVLPLADPGKTYVTVGDPWHFGADPDPYL